MLTRRVDGQKICVRTGQVLSVDDVKDEETVEPYSNRKDVWTKWIVFMSLYLCLLTLLRVFVFDVNVVVGDSMIPNFHDNDLLIAEKITFDYIDRYQVITLEVLDSQHGDLKSDSIIKRAIGLPGEHVTVYGNGYVAIDGKLLPDEHQIYSDMYGDSTKERGEDGTDLSKLIIDDVILAEDEYYVLGDNRDISADSRYYGPIPKRDILGVIIMRLAPLSDIGFGGTFDK